VKHLSLNGKLFEKEEITGYRRSVEAIVQEVERDLIFYEESGGGVTLSGGEPLYQPDFCEALLKSLKKNGFHTALDTSGYASEEEIRRILPYTDLFLYDLKLMYDKEHLKYTGVSNKIILENLKTLFESGKQVIIRFPVIPGITDTPSNIRSIIDFLTPLHHCTTAPQHFSPPHHLTTSPPELHLLPYHTTAKNKYRRFQMDDNIPPGNKLKHGRLEQLKKRFEQSGFRVVVRG
ncbi:MAG: glycyl-radical enzyme activating protein, partial [Bacteroidota bacterium]